MEKSILTREMLLQPATNLTIKEVVISKGIVYVREMTGFEKDTFEQSLTRQVEVPNIPGQKGVMNTKYEMAADNFRAKLAVVTLCDPNGTLLFHPREYVQLSKALKASDLEKIAEEAQKLNAISDEDKEALLKNSEAGLEEGSNSSSAVN